MTSVPADANQSRRRRLTWPLRIAFGIISLAAVLYLLRALADVDFSSLHNWRDQLHAPMAALALVIGLGHVIAASWMIQLLLPSDGRSGMLAVILIAQIAKYVPGRIWGVVMQKSLASPSVGILRLASANLVGMALVVLAQVSVLVAALMWKWGGGWAALVSIVFVALAVYLALSLIARLSATVPKLDWLAGRERHWSLLLTIAWLATTLALFGAWAALFLGALGLDEPLAFDGIVLTTASFIAGLASLIPAGLGVREAAFLWLGDGIGAASTEVIVGLAVATRVYLLALDALAAVVGLGMHASQRVSR